MLSPLTSHRQESWRAELLDEQDRFLRHIPGALSSSIDYSIHNTVQSGGTIVIKRFDTDLDNLQWQSDRIRIFKKSGETEKPLGTFLIASPKVEYTETGIVWSVDLLDKMTVIDQDAIETSYSLAAGSVVTDAVTSLINSAGEYSIAMTASTRTLTKAQVWPPGTTKLRIINDLLDTINYFSLSCNKQGQYVVKPYVLPAQRPIVYEFVEGSNAIFKPSWSREQDIFKVPNKVILTTTGSLDTDALVATATNEDPRSPYSYQSRGRWISLAESNIEAADQATLNSMARRRLVEASSPTATIEFQHAEVDLELHDRVRFFADGHDVTSTVYTMKYDLQVGGLISTSLREVVDL